MNMEKIDIDSYMTLHEARERVNDQVLNANTLQEVEAAKQVLREWMQAHPEEQGMRDGFELLYTLQEIIEAEQQAKHRQPKRETAAA